MPAPKGFEEYNQRIDGFEIIGGFEGTTSSNCTFECEGCGGTFKRKLSSQLYQDPDCPLCKDQEKLNRLLEAGYRLTEEFSGDTNDKHEMECVECGKRVTRTIAKQIHQEHSCPGCKVDDLRERLRQKGVKLIEEFKGNKQQQHDLECLKCGHIFKRSIHNHLHRDIACSGCKRKRAVKRSIQMLDEQGISMVGEYKGVDIKHTLRCNECDNEFDRILDNQLRKRLACPECSPVSEKQNEVEEFILQKSGVEKVFRNNRDILDGKEVDIYIPKHELAIEYHGLPWHTEEMTPARNYHHKKYEECREEGIRLIQIFGDQWRDKKEICKSMILHALNETPNTIYARECEVQEISSKRSGNFFEENHIDGDRNARQSFALIRDEEIVSCLSIVGSKDYEGDELLRFCHKKLYHVPGALSRLLSYTPNRPIHTYVDLLHGDGSGYKKNGFEELKETKLRYWYTDSHSRYPRQKFQATEKHSEREVTKEAGVKRIYGCRNKLLKLE